MLMLLAARIFLLEEGTSKYDRRETSENQVQMDWNKCKFISMGMHAYAYFFKIFLPKELRSKDNSVGMSIPSAQILVSNIFPTRRNDDSLEKWLINM